MDQAGAVDGVLAVITGVMMPTGGVNRSLLYERKELRVCAHGRRALRRVIRIDDCAVICDRVPGERIRRGRRRHGGRRGMTDAMQAARVRHRGISAATLMI